MRIRTSLIVLFASAATALVATLVGILYADHKIDQSMTAIREAYSIVTQVSQLNRLGTEVNAAGLPRVRRQWETKANALRKSIEAYNGNSKAIASLLKELSQLDKTFEEILRIYQEEATPNFSGNFSKARFYRINHLTVLLHSLSNMADRIAKDNFAQAKTDQHYRDLCLISIGILWCIVAAIWSTFLWNDIMTPVRKLVSGINKVGAGDLKHRIEGNDSKNELNDIIHSFNSMLDRLQSLTVSRKRLIDTTEQERSRIGRDLHDGICQHLAAIKLRVETIGANSPDSTKWIADNLLILQKEVQRIVKDLRPAMLDELGLVTTLHWFAEQNCSQIQVKLRINMREQEIPSRLRTPIFRIIQEATSNAIRHGHAEIIHIQLNQTDGEIDLSIEDNGRGFDSTTPSFGNGLPGMRERVEAENGYLTIDTNPGRGCCIMCSFPTEEELGLA